MTMDRRVMVVSGDDLFGLALAEMLDACCSAPGRRVLPGERGTDTDIHIVDARDLDGELRTSLPNEILLIEDRRRAEPRRGALERPNVIRRSKGMADVDAALRLVGVSLCAAAPAADEAPNLGDQSLAEHLTDRERAVLAQLRQGASTVEIALELGISPRTVGTHSRNILAKLGAPTRLQAVTFAQDAPAAPRQPQRAGDDHTPRVVVGAKYLLDACSSAYALEQAGFAVTALAGHPLAIALASARSAPDVVVIDGDPFEEVVQACSLLKNYENEPSDAFPKVVVVSESDAEQHLSMAVEAGADGFLTHGRAPADLCDAVARVAKGEAAIPSDMLAPLLRGLINQRRDEDDVIRRFARLTQAERRVVGLLAEGCTANEIHERLSVSRHTVRSHTQNVLRKLEVHSQVAAATLAIRYRLVERFGEEDPT